MNQEQMQEVLGLHKLWVNNNPKGIRANLEGANLREANLLGANLLGANKVPMFCKWYVGITDGLIHIGCKKQTIEEWDAFFASDEVYQTQRNTPDFEQIQAVYLAYKAYIQHLNTTSK